MNVISILAKGIKALKVGMTTGTLESRITSALRAHQDSTTEDLRVMLKCDYMDLNFALHRMHLDNKVVTHQNLNKYTHRLKR